MALITEAIGEGWRPISHAWKGSCRSPETPRFETLACDQAREQGKVAQRWLATRLDLDPTHLLDSQVKRIHEYKRHAHLLQS